jgi:mannose-6-phosphate isomerase-like protein (cupin superfamily)
MNLKPQYFFIGVVDFFSVLLPGGLITYFLLGMFYTNIFGPQKMFIAPTDAAVKWIIFLLVTYILGNIIFMLASFLDFTYNNFLRKKLFQSQFDLSYKSAHSIHGSYLNVDAELIKLVEKQQLSLAQYKKLLGDPKREIFNTFKWAQHFLLFKSPEALADIKRIEADSKFFRSLVITFLIIAIMLLKSGDFIIPSIFIVLSILCYYRYGDLRFKATEKAYEMIITFHYLNLEKDQSFGPAAINSSTIQTDLEKDFELKYHNRINNLISRFNNQPKQVIIKSGELNNTFFQSAQYECWYCLTGKGKMVIKSEDGVQKHFLQSNSVIPITKGKIFSFQNQQKEPLELMVLNQ